MAFVDAHAHLDGPSFADDLPQVLQRAQDAGLTHIVCIGASDGLDSNPRTLALAEAHDFIWATVGIHPHDANLVDDNVLADIEKMASHPRVVAIGETGLDYHYDSSPREQQQAAFRSFLDMSRRHNKPTIIHTRDAEEDTINILREEQAGEFGGVLHCFTGTRELADAAIDLGFYISFSGIITFKNAEALRDVARAMPKDRVLVETDCPYLAPIPNRGKRNEPSYVTHTAEKLAELWAMDVAEVRRVTGDNALRFYGLN